jgi:hypothetical protein
VLGKPADAEEAADQEVLSTSLKALAAGYRQKRTAFFAELAAITVRATHNVLRTLKSSNWTASSVSTKARAGALRRVLTACKVYFEIDLLANEQPTGSVFVQRLRPKPQAVNLQLIGGSSSATSAGGKSRSRGSRAFDHSATRPSQADSRI